MAREGRWHMDDLGHPELPSVDESVRRSLEALTRKRRLSGLRPVEEVRYRNLMELRDVLLSREAS